MRKYPLFARSQQTGFVLVISLIFLVALVVYVIFAMRIANLGERSAGNARQRTTAYYAAQSAITRAKQLIVDRDGTVLSSTGVALATVTTVPDTWANAAATAPTGLECNTESSNYGGANCLLAGETAMNASWQMIDVDTQPQFRISRLQKGTADSDDYYIITAIGYGRKNDATVVLQQVVKAAS